MRLSHLRQATIALYSHVMCDLHSGTFPHGRCRHGVNQHLALAHCAEPVPFSGRSGVGFFAQTQMRASRAIGAAGLTVALLASCSPKDEVPGAKALYRQVERSTVGYDADYWIVMRNMSGEWERVGLIFGYVDDHEECEKAADGLRAANTDRAGIDVSPPTRYGTARAGERTRSGAPLS